MLRLELRQQPAFVAGKLRGRAGKLIAPAYPAAGLYRAGFRHVGQVHHQPGRHLERVKAAVRLLHHFPGNTQRGIANVKVIAGFQIQQRHQAGSQQHRPGLRFQARRFGLQVAVQRVAVVHRFHVGKLRRIARPGHGREVNLFANRQPLSARAFNPLCRYFARTAQHPIARHIFAALLVEPFVHAVADAAQRQHAGHRQAQRQPDNQQRRRAPLPPEPA